jgi:hypothetical protein
MAVLTPYCLRAFAFACGCIAVVSAIGCRNLDNAQVDVLERELRQQEDYIYELEDYLIEYSEKLRHARLAQCPPGVSTKSTGAASRSPLREPTLDDDPVTRPTLPLNGRNKLPSPPAAPMSDPSSEAPPAGTSAPTEAPPAEPEIAPPAEQVDPESLEAPELQIGPVGATTTEDSPVAAAPLLIPDPVDYQTDGAARPTDSSVATAKAAAEPQLAAPQNNAPRLSAKELKIRKIFTQPAADETSPGSLLVVVEAVNATDEPVDAVGAASIMVMTRDGAGKPQKDERWDFTAEETAAAWQSSHLGDGLHLELPLTKPELPEGELELWARVAADDGAKLLTSADDPFRFEAAKLASLSDASTESALASTEQVEPTPLEESQSTNVPKTDEQPNGKATVAETPRPQWRTSSVRLNENRVEGFATTAGNKPASWTTKPIEGAPRVAAAPAKSNSPTWKRSTRAAATESVPAWSAER